MTCVCTPLVERVVVTAGLVSPAQGETNAVSGNIRLQHTRSSYVVPKTRQHCYRSGRLGDVYIPHDMRTGEPRGFAFVRFLDKRDADDAFDQCDGEMLNGREIRIEVSIRSYRYARTSTLLKASSLLLKGGIARNPFAFRPDVCIIWRLHHPLVVITVSC